MKINFTRIKMENLKIETVKEFHKNGELAYSDNRVYFDNIENLPQEQQELAIVKEDKSGFSRVGISQKFFDNGQLAWRIDRDKKTVENYRKNGEAIKY